MPDYDQAFGRKDQVNPVRHLIVTASGWGSLPIMGRMELPRPPVPPTRRILNGTWTFPDISPAQ